MKRIYTDIVGDLFHYGHINLLKKLKEEFGGIVIVGVMSDDLVESYKRVPVLNLEERVQLVIGCKYVDEVIPAAEAPITENFIKKHSIDLVVRGDDMSPESVEYWYKTPISLGIFKTVPYTPGVSTSQIIKRITQRHENGQI